MVSQTFLQLPISKDDREEGGYEMAKKSIILKGVSPQSRFGLYLRNAVVKSVPTDIVVTL